MNDDKLSIKISVADRYYPLRIAPENEEQIRAAAVKINQVIEHFRAKYSGQDLQDALAMASLHFVTSLMDLEKAQESDQTLDELTALDTMLGDYLQRKPH